MSDTTGNINDKEVQKFSDIGTVNRNQVSGTITKPEGTVNDLSSSSLINSSGEVLLNILPI